MDTSGHQTNYRNLYKMLLKMGDFTIQKCGMDGCKARYFETPYKTDYPKYDSTSDDHRAYLRGENVNREYVGCNSMNFCQKCGLC